MVNLSGGFIEQGSMEKILLDIKEICEYTGWGETKVREILKRPDSTFAMRCGNRWYAHKDLFDSWLKKSAKYRLKV